MKDNGDLIDQVPKTKIYRPKIDRIDRPMIDRRLTEDRP